jgi:hypothetical protein
MGNTGESPRGELVFVQALEDRHFGEVEIYRSQEGLFVMKACRTMISGDKRHLEQLHLMQELQDVASIIPIINLRSTEGNFHHSQKRAFASSTNDSKSTPSTITSPLLI